MTVAEFIVWLQGQEDQGATVQVVRHISGKGYYEQGGAEAVNFTTEATSPYCFLYEYDDLRGNQFVDPKAPYFNQRTLLLGEING